MLSGTYQRVGALAGLLLFCGAWLTGFYNNWIWALLTIVGVVAALWFALDDTSEEEANTRVVRGFATGLIIGVVARVLGMVAMVWAFDSWTGASNAKYSVFADYFKVLLNGGFWLSLLAVLLTAVAGAFVAYALPYFVAEEEEE